MTTTSLNGQIEAESKPKKDNAALKTPYTKLKEAASHKRSESTVQIRTSIMVIGIIIAMLVYFYPNLLPNNSPINKASCQKYALMIDAGSTGSRIHVYRFHQCSDHEPINLEEEELFAQTIPGLSAYPDNPQQAAESLDVLLNDALKIVPSELQRRTPIAVKATAGLRLLGQKKSDSILKTVRQHLETKYPFPIIGGEDGVAIMDGKDEGVYAWITVNFLLGNFDSTKSIKPHTAAVLDLGGGSTQIVFEPDRLPDGSLPEILGTDFKHLLKHEGKDYLLYQHSYLGYGLMEARKRMHQQVLEQVLANETENLQTAVSLSHACLPKGLAWDYTKSSTPVKFLGMGSYDDCLGVADLMLNKDKSCDIQPCSFDGIYQPPIADTFAKGPIYIFSYFHDRTQPLGLPASFRLPQLATLTESVCSGAFLENVTDVTLRDELLDRPEWCLDLSFIYRLLSYGYEIPDDRVLTVAKKIDGVETGWCLGAAIAILGDNSLKDIQ
ncbi:MAG: nucleoside phosphatase GDA1/CD39 [Benjaminiella poitrasii]|nr:MAG: nucleoside phosphatase GDA1/CD39 [Benjaminiella poitrasii]